jgi:hypothetical protein
MNNGPRRALFPEMAGAFSRNIRKYPAAERDFCPPGKISHSAIELSVALAGLLCARLR